MEHQYYKRKPLCKIWLFWFSISREEFLNPPTVSTLFLLFPNHHPWKGAYLNKPEFPLPKDTFYQVWLNWQSDSGKEVENVTIQRQQQIFIRKVLA